MRSETMSSQWIERYLRGRRVAHFRGQLDSTYFFVVKGASGALHVHLTEASDGHPIVVQVTAPRFFPAADRRRLMRLTRRWNRQGLQGRSPRARDALMTAILSRSVDPTRIGVVAEAFVPLRSGVGFDEFSVAVNASIDSGAEFFGEVAALLEVAHARSRQAWLPDAS